MDANGAWNYTASSSHPEFVAGTNYSDVFTVTSADGTTSTITVNIVGTNDATVISTATANLTETDAVLTASGNLTITDADSAATFVAGTIVLHLRQYRHRRQRRMELHRVVRTSGIRRSKHQLQRCFHCDQRGWHHQHDHGQYCGHQRRGRHQHHGSPI
ncbi:VCBS domain-containing protein [Massilia sp. B-10]|nr:VCBS domain-containing protein [Massilia sp. B-10]